MTDRQAPGRTRRRGRPSRAAAQSTPATRDRILQAACAEFAAHGYEKASVRGIARAADVDPALVHHYFGSKEQVFSAAVASVAAPAAQGVPSLAASADAGSIGEGFTRLFIGIWEDQATRLPLLAVARSALSNETAARIFQEFVTSQLMARLAGRLDAPDSQLRVELAAGQLVGTALLRYVLKAEPLASTDVETLIGHLAPVVQHHLTGTPGTAPSPRAPRNDRG